MKYPIRDPFEYFFGSRRFQLWHRHLPDAYVAVDIDLAGTHYGRVVYVVEATTSRPDAKKSRTTRAVAEAMGAHGFVIQIPRKQAPPEWMTWTDVAQLIINESPPESVIVMQVYPPPEWQRTLVWSQVQNLFGLCRSESKRGAV